MAKVISTRIPEDLYEKLSAAAKKEDKNLSKFISEAIAEKVTSSQNTDILVGKIHESCLEIEGMLSVLQAFNLEAFATLFGRTKITYATPEEKKKGDQKRDAAIHALSILLSRLVDKYSAGEDIWGITKAAVVKEDLD